MRKGISPDELAAALGVSRATIWNRMRKGELPYTSIGRRRVITFPDLAKYLGEEKARAILED